MKFNIFILLMLTVFMSGCSSWGVEPWERNILAKEKMQLEPAPLDSYLDAHIYYSKESSSGGAGVGGGGCGCN